MQALANRQKKGVKKAAKKSVQKEKKGAKKAEKKAKKALATAKKKVAKTAKKQEKSKKKVNKDCECSGHKNQEGSGGKCATHGWVKPWCYVSIKCENPGARKSSTGDSHKYVVGCKA